MDKKIFWLIALITLISISIAGGVILEQPTTAKKDISISLSTDEKRDLNLLIKIADMNGLQYEFYCNDKNECKAILNKAITQNVCWTEVGVRICETKIIKNVFKNKEISYSNIKNCLFDDKDCEKAPPITNEQATINAIKEELVRQTKIAEQRRDKNAPIMEQEGKAWVK